MSWKGADISARKKQTPINILEKIENNIKTEKMYIKSLRNEDGSRDDCFSIKRKMSRLEINFRKIKTFLIL